jgi:putative hemolysin
MLTDPDSLPIRIGIMVLLIAVHGLFAAINTALGAAGRNSEKYQATCRLIMILCTSFGAWLAFYDWRTAVGFVAAIIVFGQFFSHKIALQHHEALAEKTMWLINGVSAVLTPITKLLMIIANLFLKLLRQETHLEDEAFSEEEVMSMLEAGQESGVIKEEGKKMINSIFAFDDKLAYEVMTPRTDVFMIDVEDPLEEYFDDMMTLRHSRIPVCRGERDNIIGVLNIKDYLIKARETSYEEVDIESILRKAYFVPDTKNIDSLLFELQKSKQQIAVLIDEYGGFSGIVTMEDIIEEVVGDIDDEYDEEAEIIDKVDDSTYLVDGDVDLDDLDEELGIDLQSDSSETIGGFIIDMLGEIPDENDVGRIIEFENYRFKIMSIGERRIERVKIYILDEEEASAEEEEKPDET